MSERFDVADHALPHGFFEVWRGHGGVAHSATKQQSVVCTEAKVIKNKVVVANGGVAGNQFGTQGGVERLSADHVGADWHHAGIDFRRNLGP